MLQQLKHKTILGISDVPFLKHKTCNDVHEQRFIQDKFRFHHVKKKKKSGVRQTSENLMTPLRDSGSLKLPALPCAAGPQGPE